jgi:hypothetical protein
VNVLFNALNSLILVVLVTIINHNLIAVVVKNLTVNTMLPSQAVMNQNVSILMVTNVLSMKNGTKMLHLTVFHVSVLTKVLNALTKTVVNMIALTSELPLQFVNHGNKKNSISIKMMDAVKSKYATVTSTLALLMLNLLDSPKHVNPEKLLKKQLSEDVVNTYINVYQVPLHSQKPLQSKYPVVLILHLVLLMLVNLTLLKKINVTNVYVWKI